MSEKAQLVESELSKSELEELKRERLQYTVEYAYDHSPFYRELMDKKDVEPADIQTLEDLEQLPVVTGDDILANQPPVTDSFRFKNPDASVRRPFHTSGTTGQSKTLFVSYEEDTQIAEDVYQGYRHFGVTDSDTVVNYFPFVGLNISCYGNERGFERLGCKTIPISNTPYPSEREYELLRSHSPDVIIGLPSHVDSRGRQFEQIGDPTELGVRLIVLAGEPVTESRKQYISQVFDADVYEFLGTTEAGGFAWECHRDNHLHVIDTSVHVEATNDEGEQLPAGKEGQLVITNLLKPGQESAMPLIRYDVGDLVIKTSDERGDCGCQLEGGTKIEPPTRQGQQFSLGAVTISPQLFEDHLYQHSELQDVVQGYQLQARYDEKTGQDVVTLLLEDDNSGLVGEEIQDIAPVDSPDNPLESLGADLLNSNQHLRDTVDTVGAARINIEIVDEIEMPKGKPQRLVDNR